MKFIKKIIGVFLIVICICSTFTFATFSIDKADLYSKGKCKTLLKADGGEITVTKVFYKNGENEYPAYCMNVEKGGVGEYGNYDVTIEDTIDNDLVWRVIINGYPYQSLETLGVQDIDEAYTATKQAVYCALYGYDENSKYEAIGEAGQRTLNAMKQILNKARNSTQTKPSPEITISQVTEIEIDSENTKFATQTFKVSANCDIKDFEVTVSNENMQIEKISLSEFKVLFPVELLKESGEYELSITGDIATKPVLYGISANSNYQNYALAGEIYEGGSGNLKVEYDKNSSKVTIKKKDDENNNLQGVKFRITNENGEAIYDDLETDENGEILIEGIMPGTYYLEEIETKDGYKKLEDKVEFTIGLNEEKEIEVTNEKIIEIEEKIPETARLPVTGM